MTTGMRKVQDRREATDLLSELGASGESLSSFCRRRGVDGRSLQCWRTNLSRSGPREGGQGLRLVELTLPRSQATSRYRVHVGGATVEVEDDFQDSTLARLLAVVRSC